MHGFFLVEMLLIAQKQIYLLLISPLMADLTPQRARKVNRH